MKLTKCIVFVFTILFFTCSVVFGKEMSQVTYISSEFYYIDSGRRDGIQPDDLLEVNYSNTKAVLKVVYVSDYSSACQLMSSGMTVNVGDSAYLVKKDPAPESEVQETVSEEDVSLGTSLIQWERPEVKGYLSSTIESDVQVSRYNPVSERGYFGSIQATNVGLKNLDVNLRGKYFDISGTQAVNSALYTAFLKYTYSDDRSYWKLGRFSDHGITELGTIDGGLASIGLTDSVSAGVLMGVTSPLYFSDATVSQNQSIGVFVNTKFKGFGSRPSTMMFGFVKEWQQGEENRDYLFTTNNWNFGDKWTLYGSATFDYFQTWRSEILGETFDITRGYFRMQYQLNDNFHMGGALSHFENDLNINTRENYQKLSSGSKSVFFNYKLNHAQVVRFTTVFNSAQDLDTLTFRLQYRHHEFLGSNLRLNKTLSYSNNDNYLTWTWATRVSKPFMSRNEVTMGCEYSDQDYKLGGTNWERLIVDINCQFYFLPTVFSSIGIEKNWDNLSDALTCQFKTTWNFKSLSES